MRRPWLAIALAGGALVALAIPALSMNIVVTSIDDLPQDLAVIKTYNRVRDAFPAEGVTADVAVEADDVRSGEAAAGIALLQRQAENSEDVLKGTEVTYSDDGTVALVVDPDRRQRQRRRVHRRRSTRSATTSSRRRSAGSTA